MLGVSCDLGVGSKGSRVSESSRDHRSCILPESPRCYVRVFSPIHDRGRIQSLKDLLCCLVGCPNIEKQGYFPFGRISLPPYQIFYVSSFSFCSVNLKPFVPGHILVIPRRNVPTIDLLTEEEAADLMLVTRKMTRFIKDYYHVNSVTVAIQDGPPAGQTIPDVHVHIMPREYGDFKENDVVYDMLDEADILPHSNGNLSASTRTAGYLSIEPDAERIPRSQEEMTAEAHTYSDFLSSSVSLVF